MAAKQVMKENLQCTFKYGHLRISQDICHVRMTDIEGFLAIYGYSDNLLNNNIIYMQPTTTFPPSPQALVDCASIIFGLIWKNEHNFCTFYKSSTASIIGYFSLFFLREYYQRHDSLGLQCKIDYFQVLSMVQSIFIRLGRGKKVTTVVPRSSSRGLGTPKVKMSSIPVPAFTSNKMSSSNLQIREEEQAPDRPEPAQIARDRSLKQTRPDQ